MNTPDDRDPINAPGVERRHLTVVFSDLVGSTALSQELDPEELAEIIKGIHRTCHEVMNRFGGYVARYIGDGALTYFGWPQAAEDDAERSVRAGLALVDAVSAQRLAADRQLAVRVAVASGLVVVRTLYEPAGGADVLGEAPNLAARLQELAKPNTVVVAPSTWRLIGDMFEYCDLGEHALKGIANPVRARQVLRARPVGSRFEAYREQWLVPFVGRAEQMSLLMERWERVRKRQGQAVLISGDAGIGKSRLVHELCERVRDEPVVIRRYQCSLLHSATALYPVIQQLRIAADCWDGESADRQALKLRQLLANGAADIEPALALICNLLQVKAPDVGPLPDLAPRLLRDRLIETLCTQIRVESERAPVLAIVEDAQWIDPTTEEFVLRLLGQLSREPVCIIATSRVQFPQSWRRFECTTCMLMDSLDLLDSMSLIRSISGGQLEDRMVQRIAARADGIPLFLEELTRAVHARRPGDAGSQQRAEADIPATLQDLLAERLDRLGTSKHLAQIGAIFGRYFDEEAVQRLAEWPEGRFKQGMADLLGSGLVRESRIGTSNRLAFRHSLVQDAAYESLLKAEKKRLHGNALLYLESLPKASLPETLAFHGERGQVWDKAVRYLTAACGRATARSANREAIAHFDRALAALGHLPQEQMAPFAIDVRLRAGAALLALGDIDRLVAIMREACELALRSADKRRQAATLSLLANGLWLAGEHRAGLEHAESAEQLASEIDDFSIRLGARFNHANLVHALGMIREAARMYASIIEMVPRDLESRRFGMPGLPSVLAAGFLTWCAVELGDFPLAKRTIDQAFRIVAEVPEPYSIVYANLANGLYHLGRGDAGEAVRAFDAAKAVSDRAQMELPVAVAWLAAACVEAGRPHQALSLLDDVDRSQTYKHGGRYNWFYHHLGMAQAHLALGDLGAAQSAVGRAEEIAVAAEQIVHLAWACKVRGDILTAAGGDAESNARRAYSQALGIAAPRGLRPLEAHCHLGLARLNHRAGRTSEAAQDRLKAEEIYQALGLTAWLKEPAGECDA